MRCGQQVGGERVAAPVRITIARREVAGQAVGVKVAGDLADCGLPQLAVAQTHSPADFLLQATERVVGKPVAHAGHALGQFGLQ